MKIRRVEEKGKVEYPSFDDYQKGRRHLFTTIAAGLGLAVLSGCAPDEKPIPPEGGLHQPLTPGNQTQILGKLKAPEPKTPANQPKIRGEIAAPEAPK